MPKIEDRRYSKLIRVFGIAESNALKKEGITSPAMKALIRERREQIHDARERGLSRKAFNRRLAQEARMAYGSVGKALKDDVRRLNNTPAILAQQTRINDYNSFIRESRAIFKQAGLDTQSRNKLLRLSYLPFAERRAALPGVTGKVKSLLDAGFTDAQSSILAKFQAFTQRQKDGFQKMLEDQAIAVEERIKDIMGRDDVSYDEAKKIYAKEINEQIADGSVDPWDILRDILSPTKRQHRPTDYHPEATKKARKAKKDKVKTRR